MEDGSKKIRETMKKKVIPKGRRTIECKWIFKIKRKGIFIARLAACVYSKVPGVDFHDSFVPVINDSSFRIMLIT
jgi:hypothetical protein